MDIILGWTLDAATAQDARDSITGALVVALCGLLCGSHVIAVPELMEKFHAQWVRHSTFANELLRKFAMHLQDIASTASAASGSASGKAAESAAGASASQQQRQEEADSKALLASKLQVVAGLTR